MNIKYPKTAYKVVRCVADGQFIGLSDIGESLCFRPMVWTEAPNDHGPIAAYRSLPSAIAGFAARHALMSDVFRSLAYGEVQVWKCGYAPWTDPLVAVVGDCDDDSIPSDVPVLPIDYIRMGTVLCKWIRLGEPVPVDHIAHYFRPGAVVQTGGMKHDAHVVPVISVQEARVWVPLSYCTYALGPDDKTRQVIQQDLSEIELRAPALARIAKAAFQAADDLARAQGIKQEPFLKA